MDLLTLIIVAAMILTIVVLVTGIGSMAHGGKFDEEHSNQLMFARIGLQGATILLLGFATYLAAT